MLKSALTWFSVAPITEVAMAKGLLKTSVAQGCNASPAVRKVLLAEAHTLSRPHVVWAGFGNGKQNPRPQDQEAYLKAESKLVQVRN